MDIDCPQQGCSADHDQAVLQAKARLAHRIDQQGSSEKEDQASAQNDYRGGCQARQGKVQQAGQVQPLDPAEIVALECCQSLVVDPIVDVSRQPVERLTEFPEGDRRQHQQSIQQSA